MNVSAGRFLAGFAALAGLAAPLSAGCESRFERTLRSLSWSGGTAKARRIRDALSQALKASTPQSLERPTLVDVTATVLPGAGLLEMHWVAMFPTADGARFTSDTETAGVEFSGRTVERNERDSSDLMVLYAVVPLSADRQVLWAKLTGNDAVGAVLTKGGNPASNSVSARRESFQAPDRRDKRSTEARLPTSGLGARLFGGRAGREAARRRRGEARSRRGGGRLPRRRRGRRRARPRP